MNTERKYYVYRYNIVETKEIFYIGKGCGNRYKQLGLHNRGKFFMDMYNSHNCEVTILWNNMTEEEAFRLEKTLIAYYRQYTDNRLANVCDGGGGCSGHRWSEEEKRQIGLRGMGKNNPNYGNRWSDAQKKSLSEHHIASGRYKGKNNPNSHKVQCIETGVVFDTMSEAAASIGLKCTGSIHHAIHYPNGVAAGLHWRYVDN